jgi:hypothetical protein
MRAYYTILPIHDLRLLVLIHPSRRASADSPLPGARSMNASLPSVVMPLHGQGRPDREVGVHLEGGGIQEQVVQLDAIQATPRQPSYSPLI